MAPVSTLQYFIDNSFSFVGLSVIKVSVFDRLLSAITDVIPSFVRFKDVMSKARITKMGRTAIIVMAVTTAPSISLSQKTVRKRAISTTTTNKRTKPRKPMDSEAVTAARIKLNFCNFLSISFSLEMSFSASGVLSLIYLFVKLVV